MVGHAPSVVLLIGYPSFFLTLRHVQTAYSITSRVGVFKWRIERFRLRICIENLSTVEKHLEEEPPYVSMTFAMALCKTPASSPAHFNILPLFNLSEIINSFSVLLSIYSDMYNGQKYLP